MKRELIIILVLLLSINFIIAEETGVTITSGDNNAIDVGGVDFLEKVVRLFNENKFIITQTGIDRGCDYIRTGSQTSVPIGQGASVSAASVCTSGHGQVIVYSKLIGDATLYPKLEFRDSGEFDCVEAPGKEKCVVEFYCCPYGECSSNSDCVSQKGTGSQCTTKSYVYYDAIFKLPNYYSGGSLSTTYKTCTAGSGCIPKSCSQLGKNCGSWDNGCGQTIGCGSCSGSQTCTGGLCTNPDNSGGGGGTTTTTKKVNGEYCDSNDDCVSDYCKTSILKCEDAPTSTCGDNICSIQERLTGCVPDCETTLSDKIQIYSLAVGKVDGTRIDGKLIPGQQVKIAFTVRSDVGYQTTPYLVEAGIIPFSTAQAWDMAKESGFYSLFAVTESSSDACCSGQPNIADNRESLNKNVWTSSQTKDFEYILKVPDSSTKDLCGSEKYWDSNSSKYLVYAIVKNGCYKDGYRRNVFITQVVNLDYNASGTTQGKTCTADYQCALGEKCLDAPGWFTGKTCQGGAASTQETIIKKYPLTKEEIGKSTSGDLVSAACYGNSECGSRQNYSVSCIPISKLVADGTMTVSGEKDLFSSAKNTINVGIIGGGAAATFCSIGLATGAWTGGVGTIVGCGVGGALLLAGLTEVGTQTGIKISNIFSSDLQKAIESGDSNKVGLCTAEKSSSIDIGGFLSNIGNKIHIFGDPTTDGIIVVVGGFVVVIILLNSLGGRK